MGMSHVLYIREDCIRGDKAKSKELQTVLGEAVIDLCLNPKVIQQGSEHIDIREKTVMNYGGCVGHAAELHSTDKKLLLWAGNCLRSFDEITDEELEEVKQIFESQYQERLLRKSIPIKRV